MHSVHQGNAPRCAAYVDSLPKLTGSHACVQDTAHEARSSAGPLNPSWHIVPFSKNTSFPPPSDLVWKHFSKMAGCGCVPDLRVNVNWLLTSETKAGRTTCLALWIQLHPPLSVLNDRLPKVNERLLSMKPVWNALYSFSYRLCTCGYYPDEWVSPFQTIFYKGPISTGGAEWRSH